MGFTFIRWILMSILLFLPLCIDAVGGQCNMENRIKHRDNGVIVTSREIPCELVMASPDDRQVVAVFYNMVADCIDHGDIQIFDGNTTNNLIRRFCDVNPLSYASRANGLIVRPLSPYKPFNLEIHLVRTTQMLPLNSSRIVSPVYKGYTSIQGNPGITPNNFRGTYIIPAEENVTMELTFNKFDLYYTPVCGDKVEIMPSSKTYCGNINRNYKPPPALFTTDRLHLVFTTDAQSTYTGIDITYKVCFVTIKVSDTSGSLVFPIRSNNEITCVFKFSFDGQRNITLKEMNFNQGCTNNHQIIVDGVDRTSNVLGDCSSKRYSIVGNDVKIRFTSTQGGSFSTGRYEISIPMTTTLSGTSTYTIQGVTSPNNYSQDQIGIAVPITVSVVIVVIALSTAGIMIILYNRGRLPFRRKTNNTIYEATSHESSDHTYTAPTLDGTHCTQTYENNIFPTQRNVESNVYYNQGNTVPTTPQEYEDRRLDDARAYEGYIIPNTDDNDHQYSVLQ